MERMPVVFVGHGSPTNVVEENRFTRGWKDLSKTIPLPEAILCVSAHWYGEGTVVSAAEEPETIHDFYGFPQELYRVVYPAPGAPETANRAAALLGERARIDPARGLDHGAWSVLHFMYPQAEIPVCQLSVDARLSTRQSYDLGRALRPLRDEGVLILGSGDIVHNLARVDWGKTDGYAWADEFDAYVRAAIVEGRHEDVIEYQKAGPISELAFTYRDHYEPLLYVLGAAEEGEPARVFNDARVMGSLSMTSSVIG